MGCETSFFSIKPEEIKSSIYIKEYIKTKEKTPGGSSIKVNKCREKLVPRLKPIETSLLMNRRINNINSFSPLSFPSSASTLKSDKHYSQ